MHPLAAAFLAAVEVGLCALGITGLGDRDDNVLPGDQILIGDVTLGRDNPGPPVVSVLLDDLGEFVTNDAALAFRFGEDVLEVRDLRFDFGQVLDDPLALQRGQPTQLHIQNRLGLNIVDLEQFDQSGTGHVDSRRGTD